MSVIVRGMKMPKNCFYCAMSSFGVCNIAVRIWDISTRPDWCPLVELPEKHGPMIDCQALLEEARRLSGPLTGDGWSNQGIFSLIARQPTIVEAEGEE